MTGWLLPLLRCPFADCRSPLDLESLEVEREVREGRLVCRGCRREYHIADGVVSLYGPLPDAAVKRGEIDGWRRLMGLGPRPEGPRGVPPARVSSATGPATVTVATSWDASGRTPASVRFGEGVTLAVGFSDRSQVERVEVDASSIGRSSRLPLTDLHDEHALARGVIARVGPGRAGQSLQLPFRARLVSGVVLEGTVPVTVSADAELLPEFARLLALPDAPPQPSERASERTYWQQCTVALAACMQLLDLRGGERILEIGAGSGWASRRFAERGCRVVALDINPENMDTATSYLYLAGVHFERVLADAETLPFADASFDVVFGCAVLHHAAHMPRLLGELKRVVAPRGRIVLLNETLRPVTQSEAEALSVSPHELAAGVNEHAPTLLEYKRAFLSTGLWSSARRTDHLDARFFGRGLAERVSLLFGGGAVNFVATRPPHWPSRLPNRPS